MKLTVVFLMAALALCSDSAFASLQDYLPKPHIPSDEIQKSIAKPVMESIPNPLFSNFSLLKLILRGLGIPVDHLVEGSKKCVEELGSESVEAVKSLLGVLTYFG